MRTYDDYARECHERALEERGLDCPVCFGDGIVWHGAEREGCPCCDGFGRVLPEEYREPKPTPPPVYSGPIDDNLPF